VVAVVPDTPAGVEAEAKLPLKRATVPTPVVKKPPKARMVVTPA